ncbi:MAG TPA: transcriptional regulator [Prolixibacteraceae bacterium]|nr:transcriptional regulator [Prolixibacteraceae bacterium]
MLNVLNGKWKMRIVLCLASEPKRFNEIKKCHEISPRILSKKLKELKMNEVITRTEVNDNLKTVIYALTEHGNELIPHYYATSKMGNRTSPKGFGYYVES